MEEKFRLQEGKLQIGEVAQALLERQQQIAAYLEKGQLQQAAIRFLAMTKVISVHFAKDELYNYITDDFNPNDTCTSLFDTIVQKSGKHKDVANYLYSCSRKMHGRISNTHPSSRKQKMCIIR